MLCFLFLLLDWLNHHRRRHAAMRLIDTRTRKLTDHFEDVSSLKYAILSHRWTAQEVLYEDMVNGRGRDKGGYKKLDKCCNQAFLDGFKYVWIDTCCIDKSSSAELTEAINSMYQWYEKAEVCYVYLHDVRGHNSLRQLPDGRTSPERNSASRLAREGVASSLAEKFIQSFSSSE